MSTCVPDLTISQIYLLEISRKTEENKAHPRIVVYSYQSSKKGSFLAEKIYILLKTTIRLKP